VADARGPPTSSARMSWARQLPSDFALHRPSRAWGSAPIGSTRSAQADSGMRGPTTRLATTALRRLGRELPLVWTIPSAPRAKETKPTQRAHARATDRFPPASPKYRGHRGLVMQVIHPTTVRRDARLVRCSPRLSASSFRTINPEEHAREAILFVCGPHFALGRRSARAMNPIALACARPDSPAYWWAGVCCVSPKVGMWFLVISARHRRLASVMGQRQSGPRRMGPRTPAARKWLFLKWSWAAIMPRHSLVDGT